MKLIDFISDQFVRLLCFVLKFTDRRPPDTSYTPHERITRAYEWRNFHFCLECRRMTLARFIEWDDKVTTAECGFCGFEEVIE